MNKVLAFLCASLLASAAAAFAADAGPWKTRAVTDVVEHFGRLISALSLDEWLKLIGLCAAIALAAKFLSEYARRSQQQREEFRWKRAELAQQLLAGLFANPRAQAALQMLVWWERDYAATDGRRFKITTEIALAGLRVKEMTFTPEEQFVRECFEGLYERTNGLEHGIRSGLLLVEDVLPPLAFYADCIAEHQAVHDGYWETCGYELTKAFFDRFRSKPAAGQ